MNTNPKKTVGEPNGKMKTTGKVLLIVAAVAIALSIFFPKTSSVLTVPVSYSQFIRLVDSGSVAEVELSEQDVYMRVKDTADPAIVSGILNTESTAQTTSGLFAISSAPKQTVYTTGRVDDPDLVRRLTEQDVDFYQSAPQTPSLFQSLLSWIMPVLVMCVIYYLLFRYVTKRMGAKSGGDNSGGIGGMMNGMMGGVGKSKAKVYNVEKSTGVTFNDVAGQNEAKESLTEMVDYLHDPEKYKKIGAKQPKGALLVGPPGTGKTLLAKAVAGEAGVPFHHLTGSEFVEMFVGVGASRVRDLFQTAKKNAPCIIFIDEIDAIGKRRDNQLGGNDEREQTLNQLLSEMDGFDTSTGIVVLAATNRPEVLDKALLRPGRFDRRIIVDKPDLIGRKSILDVHASKVRLGEDVNLHSIALATSGATGADLANMINEAALRAVKLGRESVLQEDLMEAVEVVIAGKEKKDRILSKGERRIVAYHEVGHALVSALQKKSQPVQKITIVPRTMGSLGYTMSVPEEDRYLMTSRELRAEITALLGGRAAEIVEFSDTSTGASNDIERATKLARSMVTQYGMSEAFGSMGLESSESQYLDGRNVMTCSEQTTTLADKEVKSIIESCQKKAIELLEEHRAALSRIAEYLLVRENISGEEFMQLLGEGESVA